MEALILKLLNYGTAPALVVLASLVGFLIKKLDENAKRDAERSIQFSKEIAATSNRLQESLDAHKKETDARFQENADRMSCFDRDYVQINTYYRDMSGWRTEQDQTRAELRDEFRSIRTELGNLNTQLIKTILEGVRNGTQR